MKRLLTIVSAALVLFSGCDRSSESAEIQQLRKEIAGLKAAQANATAKRKQPTAAELFELRTKCAALGEQILDDNRVGNALTQSQISHCDFNTGRCYVALTVQTADLSAKNQVYSRYLMDGHTKELLAFQKRVGETKSGHVSNTANYDYDAADDFIEKMMAEE